MDLTPPPNWGTDNLTDFFDQARRNGYASFIKRKELFTSLVEVDAIFRTVNMDNHPLVYPALMMLKAHSSFLTASELALTTRISETFAICRAVIENALYGFHMRENPKLIKIWTGRHDSPAARAAVRKAFQMSDILNGFKKKQPQWGDRVVQLYDDSIDWGAHPNERSVHGSLSIQESDDAVGYEINYLTKNQDLLFSCALHVVRVGVALVHVQHAVLPDRFNDALLQRLDAIKLTYSPQSDQ